MALLSTPIRAQRVLTRHCGSFQPWHLQNRKHPFRGPLNTAIIDTRSSRATLKVHDAHWSQPRANCIEVTTRGLVVSR